MKYFPFKTVLFCIFIIPLLYTATLVGVEKGLSIFYQNKIEQVLLGNKNDKSSDLTDSNQAVQEELKSNSLVDGDKPQGNVAEDYVQAYPDVDLLSFERILQVRLKSFIDHDWFLNQARLFPAIRIHRKDGSILYVCPLSGGTTNFSPDLKEPDVISGIFPPDVTVEVIIPLRHNTLLSNIILLLYLMVSFLLFQFFYKRGIKRAERDENQRVGEIQKLKEDERQQNEQLEELKKQRAFLAEQLKEAKSDFQEESRKASIAEEELFEEIARLEKKLDENRSNQAEKEQEIEELKDQLERLERRKTGTRKRKAIDVLEKRLTNLYKNVDMNKKALTGMMELTEDMQIKAEEVIHQLNDDPSGVTVKRKVFAGKKNKTASFEVLFAYNGRLYFRNVEGNRIEVLVIGTKNSQDKDMEFLHYI
ncbi:conserved exported hypothetical protein [Desulfamplus magnetovallimortis]|uniref:Uncharacterized protein n=1 Tax=Desulfamplus magnetovallimortis TaxID=1246637 RepID=A0A1W1H890_9BACT|nr:hypothetical protein [Desulfamplus magnetovallimortis]SLM28654.1 conserved exported hypothetical protein [Desulfamplus magnetovallimortis]